MKAKVQPPERRHHLDKRAAELATQPGDDDELLTIAETAKWLGVSTQWLHSGRHYGYGPPFVQLGPKLIRYRRGTVREWLLGRSHRCASEYIDRTAKPRPGHMKLGRPAGRKNRNVPQARKRRAA